MKTTKTITGFVAALAVGAAFSVLSVRSNAQVIQPPLPAPKAFVSNLDLACHKVEGGVTPARSVLLNHLNPVLQALGFRPEQAHLGELEQLCVPVAKNGVIPPAAVLPFVQEVDLACYAAKSAEPQPAVSIRLSQLNPVVQQLGLPDHSVRLGSLRQMCTPVAKNGRIPSDRVLSLVKYVDVACYDVKPYNEFATPGLRLSNLNPVLVRMGLPSEAVKLTMPEQLCVPVAKNDSRIPPEIANIVQWVDFEKFPAVIAGAVTSVPLKLTHLNPVFASQESFEIKFGPTQHLNLPVAKNGQYPSP